MQIYHILLAQNVLYYIVVYIDQIESAARFSVFPLVVTFSIDQCFRLCYISSPFAFPSKVFFFIFLNSLVFLVFTFLALDVES